MWRFESVHGFASVGNLYQKMHFAGSNPDTASKRAKGIYKTPKKCRGEKTGEISRNLPFSRFSSFGSKLTCHHGWDGRIRTDECRSQSPVPYRLATSHYYYRNILSHRRLCVKCKAELFSFRRAIGTAKGKCVISYHQVQPVYPPPRTGALYVWLMIPSVTVSPSVPSPA